MKEKSKRNRNTKAKVHLLILIQWNFTVNKKKRFNCNFILQRNVLIWKIYSFQYVSKCFVDLTFIRTSSFISEPSKSLKQTTHLFMEFSRLQMF